MRLILRPDEGRFYRLPPVMGTDAPPFWRLTVSSPHEPAVRYPFCWRNAAARAARPPCVQRVTITLFFGISPSRPGNWLIGMFT